MEGQQKETEYPGWHGNATGKELWSGEDKLGRFFKGIGMFVKK